MLHAAETRPPRNEPDAVPDLFSVQAEPMPPEHPLQVLKVLVLSIDWEISEDTVRGFLQEIGRLIKKHGADPVNRKWFELLTGIGHYVYKRKSDIHPEAIRLLHAVYADLEASFFPDRMPEQQRRERLLFRVAEYNRLRDIVRTGGTSETENPKPSKQPEVEIVPTPSEDSKPQISGESAAEADRLLIHEAFAQALEEMRRLIQAEFRALRAEIRLWRAEKKG